MPAWFLANQARNFSGVAKKIGRLRSLFMGDSDAVKKFNEEVKKRLFNPYKREKSAVARDWAKRGKAHKVSL